MMLPVSTDSNARTAEWLLHRSISPSSASFGRCHLAISSNRPHFLLIGGGMSFATKDRRLRDRLREMRSVFTAQQYRDKAHEYDALLKTARRSMPQGSR